MKLNKKFYRSFKEFVTELDNSKSTRGVAKVSSKLQPLVEYFDDDGLNLLTEQSHFQFGYILGDKTMCHVNNRKHIMKNYLYIDKLIERGNSKNDYINDVNAYLPTKHDIKGFLKQLLNFSVGRQWIDNSKVTKAQKASMEKMIA